MRELQGDEKNTHHAMDCEEKEVRMMSRRAWLIVAPALYGREGVMVEVRKSEEGSRVRGGQQWRGK